MLLSQLIFQPQLTSINCTNKAKVSLLWFWSLSHSWFFTPADQNPQILNPKYHTNIPENLFFPLKLYKPGLWATTLSAELFQSPQQQLTVSAKHSIVPNTSVILPKTTGSRSVTAMVHSLVPIYVLACLQLLWQNTLIETNLGRKGFIWLTSPRSQVTSAG